MPTVQPRYERIVSLILVVILGLAVVMSIDNDPNILRARLGGDLPTITVSWLLIAAIVVITSTGADLLARAHPQMQHRSLPSLNLGIITVELAPGFWILPSLSIIASFAFFRLYRQAQPALAFEFALVTAGGLLMIVLLGQHYALDRRTDIQQRARLVLQAVTYMIAFGCFSAIYYARFRTLYSAALVGASGSLLAYEILQWNAHKGHMNLAVIIGLFLSEITWALNYWGTSFLLAGSFLLIVFYITVSILQHHATGTLKRNLFVEYGLLGSGLLIAIVYATFINAP